MAGLQSDPQITQPWKAGHTHPVLHEIESACCVLPSYQISPLHRLSLLTTKMQSSSKCWQTDKPNPQVKSTLQSSQQSDQ